jgi:hypothetical protein
MADYSRFLFDAISGAGDAFVDNRQRKAAAQQLAYENQFGQRKYSDALMQDERDFGFRKSEAERSQRNADRSYGLDAERVGMERVRLDPEEVRLYRTAKGEGWQGTFADWRKQFSGGSEGSSAQERIINRLMEVNPGMTYDDALARTQRENSPSFDLRRDEMALTAARDDPQFAIDPEGTITKYRQYYGIGDGPKLPPSSSPARPGGPDESGAVGSSLRGISGMWRGATEGMTPTPLQRPTEGPAASSAAPTRPSSVPQGSAYSPSRQMWRAPDGRVFDAKGMQVP